MKRCAYVIALVIMCAAAAGAQVLPMPNIIDHQVASLQQGGNFLLQENIQTAYNWVFVYVTCGFGGEFDPKYTNCVAGAVTDSNGDAYTFLQHIYNESKGWGMDIFYANIPTSGETEISAGTTKICGPCSYDIMVEQIEGIDAYDQ